ncbi:MAG: hypothetical protein Q4A27_01180 [bacterium]|nr:hypothetical protein [bacterium]
MAKQKKEIRALKDFQIEAIHRKISFLLVIILGILLISGVGIVAKFSDLAFIRGIIFHKAAENSKREVVTIAGVPSCLKLKSGEETTHCEYGIRTSEGKYYALTNSGNNPINLYGEAGSAEGVEITGELTPAGEKEKYDIVGTITPNK